MPLLGGLWSPILAQGIPEAQVVTSYYRKVLDLLPRLSKICGDKLFFVGERPCIADYFFAEWLDCHLIAFQRHELAAGTNEIPANLQAIRDRIFARPRIAAYIASPTSRSDYGRHPAGSAYAGQVRLTGSPHEGEMLQFCAAFAFDPTNKSVAGRQLY